MKRVLFVSIIIAILAGGVLASTPAAKDPLAYPVQNLYAAPDEDSTLIYKIPINVEVVDVSPDANWHKVKISYHIGPLSYTYVGWVKVPVGDLQAARIEKVAKAPADENSALR